MKTFAAVVATACMAATAAAYSTDACPSTELIKLLALADVPEVSTCQDVSTFQFLPPVADPTEEQILLMCITPECNTTISALLALDPTDCVSTFGDYSVNVLELAESYAPSCAALGL